MLFFCCCWLSFVGVVMCVLMFIFVCMVMNIYDDFKKRKKIYKNVGPVHTYLDVFESTTFSWRIWLLSS